MRQPVKQIPTPVGLIAFSVITISPLVVTQGQLIDTKQVIDIICSACDQPRLAEKPPELCCRCIDERANCNNDIASGGNRAGERQRPELSPGLTCVKDVECELFGECDGRGCDLFNDASVEFDFEEDRQRSCPFGQKVCCDPVDADTLRLGLVSGGNPLGEPSIGDPRKVCDNPKLSAVQDFGHGVTCGKRDSRTYFDANLAESYTNPGEWPWVVLIFSGGEYVGAGALMDNDVVVTVAHKVRDYVQNPNDLIVRLGDWNPNERDIIEEHPHINMRVDCVRIHPDADLDNTLANNVAVLKLQRNNKILTSEEVKKVVSVIDLKSAPRRPADVPDGVKGFSKLNRTSFLDLRVGLVSLNEGQDPLGVPNSNRPTRSLDAEIAPSYINTICLPRSEQQFRNHREKCWVAAWRDNLERQREVDLPLVTKSECERRLRPIFEERGVNNWRLQPSEICAGGVRNKDSCKGEGGAPLVCYDKSSDQYFAVGLVNYGFGCEDTHPAVYTNLANPSVKNFIRSSFRSNFC